jgi:hypothetical protein
LILGVWLFVVFVLVVLALSEAELLVVFAQLSFFVLVAAGLHN